MRIRTFNNINGKCILVCFVILSCAALTAQSSCYVTFNQYAMQFDESGGALSNGMTTSGNCSGAFTYLNKPSWVTIYRNGNTLDVSVSNNTTGSSRTAYIEVQLSGSYAGDFNITQSGPPQPCTVSGFNDGNYSGSLQTIDFPITFSNCSSTALTFTGSGGGSLPTNEISVSQTPNANNIRVVLQPNNTASQRSYYISGNGANNSNVFALITQDCNEKTWYVDSDGDGFRNPGSVGEQDCANRGAGWTQNTTVDVCPTENNAQNVLITWYKDSDGDGFKDPSGNSVQQCNEPSGNWTQNSVNDQCPDQYSVTNNGCDPDCANGALSSNGLYGQELGAGITSFAMPELGGSTSARVDFSNNGCAAPYTISVQGTVASGFTVSTTPNSNIINITATALNTAGATRYSSLSVVINPGNHIVGTLDISQDGPPPPCTVTGFNDRNYSGSLQTIDFPITFSNCSPTTLTFTDSGGGSLPTNEIRVYQTPSANNIRVVLQPNNTASQRSYYISGTGSNNANVFALITQDCNEKTWYADSDGDGFRDSDSVGEQDCADRGVGWTQDDTVDVCPTENNAQNVLIIWYADSDGDGFRDSNSIGEQDCADRGAGWTQDDTVDVCPSIYDPSNNCNVTTDPGSLNQNYVYTRTYQRSASEMQNEEGVDQNNFDFFTASEGVIQNITYFDGLGRPIQQIGIDQSPDETGTGNFGDIITHMAYDGFGRMDKEWLPVSETTGDIGSYRTQDLEALTRNYYKNHQDYCDDFPTLLEAEANTYSQKYYEPSPLNRVLKQAAPGEDWKLDLTGDDHSIEFEYLTNTQADTDTFDAADDNVRLFGVTTIFSDNTYTPTLISDTDPTTTQTEFYHQGELYKNITNDENHETGDGKLHTTEEFTDKQGRVVLKRTYANIGAPIAMVTAHDTYYIYDDFGNLTYVLPPKMEGSTATLSEINTNMAALAYQYVYDHRNRLIEKKIPGKEKEYIVYNKLDQPVLTQDANQRLNNEWLFTKYDAFGRIVYTGIYTHSNNVDQSGMHTIINDYYENNSENKLYEQKLTTSANYYYSNQSFPISGLDVLTVNYYDGYDFDLDGAPTSVMLLSSNNNESNATNVHGLATGSKIKVLETDDWINSVTYYDKKARPIYSYSKNNYLVTTDIIETALDFIGKPEKSKTTHTKGGNTIVTIDNFQYDHVGRLLAQTQCIGNENLGDDCPSNGSIDTNVVWDNDGDVVSDIEATNSIIVKNDDILPGPDGSTTLRITNGSTQELIVFNDYDELGQLTNKKVGGAPGSDYTSAQELQDVSYKYNVRGWLTTINDISDATPDKLFNFNIGYTDGDTPLFNGNISNTQWRTDNLDNTLKTYQYGYDPLNRITSATDDTADNRYSLTDVEYDKNGNILKLKRNGHTAVDGNGLVSGYGVMDDLTYSYTGNRLKAVDDDIASSATQGFIDGAEQLAEYIYDANGNLQSDANKGITSISYNHFDLPTEVVFDNNPNKKVNYVYAADMTRIKKLVVDGTTNQTTDYNGKFIYENDVLQFINHSGGYTIKNGNNWDYIYQFKDNLGNVRLSYSDINDDGSVDSAEILHERNNYPFGMLHKGYNGNIQGTVNNYMEFQGQELDKSLDLNWHHFKYRTYDRALGRFLQIDPLASTYVYNSTYAFAENNVTSGIDLEGKELSFELDGNRATAVFGPRANIKTLQEASSEVSKRKAYKDAVLNKNTQKFDNAQSGAGTINYPPTHISRVAAAYPQSGYRLAQTVGVAAKEAATDFFGGAIIVNSLRFARGASSVWNLGRFARGRSIERTLGANQQWARNFPGIDKIQDGAATSIKSLDLTAKSYNKGNNLLNKLKGYVDKLDNFGGRVEWAGDVVEEGVDYSSKTLELAVETGQGTTEQWDQIGKAIDYALDKDINFTIKFID